MADLNSTISLKDTDLFKDILEVIRVFTNDDRVSEDVRQEYISKLNECIGNNNGTKTT